MKKVSREGIVLIKSFEGFRPRAVARPEGGWIIGYGHTLSAREGATVSEADAELLLRYDLLAVEKRLNETGPTGLNQHQFDALASFAFSVGLDRFETSDVLDRLTAGDQGAAGEAMLAWPETRSPSAGARRRAAERALFAADPSRPVALAELLAVPVVDAAASPEPAPATVAAEDEVAPTQDTQPAELAAETVDETEARLGADDAANVAHPARVEPRVAAVAALLGELDAATVGPAVAPIVPRFETPAVVVAAAPAPSDPGSPEIADGSEPLEQADRDEVVPSSDIQSPANDVEPEPLPELTATTDLSAVEADEDTAPSVPADVGPGSISALAFSSQRYSPYGAAVVGPLPFATPAEIAGPSDAPTEPLVLTSPDEAPATLTRPAWTPEERSEIETSPAGESLFGEDLSLTQGGQTFGRPDFEPEAPERFDWSETGAFIGMGAVGLIAFGASMAAFRLASEQGGGDETSIIGWVLAVIGVACVGVSSFNLYRKFGLAGSDR